MLRELRNFVAEQWYRFLIGISFLTLVNFALLVVTASDKLKALLPFRITELVFLLVPAAFIGAWVLGFVLERYVRFPQQQEREAVKRSPTWQETHRKLDEILARLERIEEKKKK